MQQSGTHCCLYLPACPCCSTLIDHLLTVAIEGIKEALVSKVQTRTLQLSNALLHSREGFRCVLQPWRASRRPWVIVHDISIFSLLCST